MATIERDLLGNPTISFYKPPQPCLVPEMDFNSVLYFKQSNQKTERTKREELWNIILHPNTVFELGVNIKMKPTVGDQMVPAHIPNIIDTLNVHPTVHELFRWHVLHDLPLTDRKLIPSYIMNLLDPEPSIDLDQVPFNITTESETLKISMASYSDGFQVVKLPRFHNVLHIQIFRQLAGVIPDHLTVVIDPYSKKYIPQVANISPVPAGAILVCWNVRGVARQSFKRLFKAFYDLHKPSIVILLETRNTVSNISEIITKLPGRYSFVHSPMESHSGGAILIWRIDRVHCCDRVSPLGEERIMDAMVQGMLEGQRRRPRRS